MLYFGCFISYHWSSSFEIAKAILPVSCQVSITTFWTEICTFTEDVFHGFTSFIVWISSWSWTVYGGPWTGIQNGDGVEMMRNRPWKIITFVIWLHRLIKMRLKFISRRVKRTRSLFQPIHCRSRTHGHRYSRWVTSCHSLTIRYPSTTSNCKQDICLNYCDPSSISIQLTSVNKKIPFWIKNCILAPCKNSWVKVIRTPFDSPLPQLWRISWYFPDLGIANRWIPKFRS